MTSSPPIAQPPRLARLRAMWGVVACCPVLALWLWPLGLPTELAGLNFTHWHTVLEFASMLVCGAVAAVAWNGRELATPRSVQVLGAASLGALVLDLAHTLSFPGMPDLLGANSLSRTAALFMAGRLLIALALLVVAALPADPQTAPRWARWAPAGVALYVAGIIAWALGWPETLPALVVDGQGLTPAKRGAEYAIAALFAIAAVLFARRSAAPQPFNGAALLSAAGLMAIGELVFTQYTRPTDLAMTIGHLYKVAGFWMLYRTIVADSIRAPYQRLIDSRELQQATEDQLRTITDGLSVMVARVDVEQRYRFGNRHYER